MLFVFLALLEFALVNSFMRKSEKYEKLSNKYGTKKGIMKRRLKLFSIFDIL
jgi:hypothetical protein